ncbi:MAG: hypothetical protein OSB57_03295 [Planctomycetota bacterium]|jgi:hypothetical protein|nr:hypothetical protein [Planctomycetota bacterium]
MTNWKIKRRDGICAGCERAFEDGERIVNSLSVGPDGLARQEHCVQWWEGKQEGCATQECSAACGERAQALEAESGEDSESAIQDLFWWYGRHLVDRKRTVQLDLGALERLFLELEGREEQGLRELRYLLCLLLMRKRRLKVQKLIRDGSEEAFLVRRPRHEERYKVYVYDFDADRMAEMRTELQAIFDGAEGEGGIQLSTADAPDSESEAQAGSDAEVDPESDSSDLAAADS